MKPLPPTRLSEYDEVYCPVGSASTIRVKKVGYSVPARLIGQELKVEVYEQRAQSFTSGRELLLALPRHCGDRGVVLDYRHVIDHLLRKPGAFERYRYREELFPSRPFGKPTISWWLNTASEAGRWSICGCSNWPARWARATLK